MPCLSVSQSVSDVVAKTNLEFAVFAVAMPLILSLRAIVSVAGDMGYSFLLSHSRVKLHVKNVKSKNLPSHSVVD